MASWLKVDEVAQVLGVSPKRIRKLLETDVVPYRRAGPRQIRFNEEHVDWIRNALLAQDEMRGRSPDWPQIFQELSGRTWDDSDCVYFIGCEEVRRVKIGRAIRPQQRLCDLQVGCPFTLRILHAIPGGDGEYDLHQEFKSYRLHGEWFEVRGKLRRYLLLELFNHRRRSGA